MVAAVVILALGGAGVAYALSRQAAPPGTSTSVTITVLDSTTASPIAGALVFVGGISGTTNSSGVVTLIVPNGTWAAQATATGYQVIGTTLALTGGTATHTFDMVPQPSPQNIVVTPTVSPPTVSWQVTGLTAGGSYSVVIIDLTAGGQLYSGSGVANASGGASGSTTISYVTPCLITVKDLTTGNEGTATFVS